MIKIRSAPAEIATHRPQNFYVDSQNLYALGVHGDFHLDTCLATWTRGHVGRFKIAGYLKYIHMSWPQEKSFIFLGSILAKSRGLQWCDDKISQIRIELINYVNIAAALQLILKMSDFQFFLVVTESTCPKAK